jgi:amino acid adenylation domain-containing protein
LSETAYLSPLIAPLLEDRAGASQPAVRAGDLVMSYGELRQAVRSCADGLRRSGVRPGDRVAICLPKSLSSLTMILGTLAAGAAYVPLNHRVPGTQALAILEDIRPRMLIAAPETMALLEPAHLPGLLLARPASTPGEPFDAITRFPGGNLDVPSPPDLAAVFYTSGTTGEPKGIMLSHRNMASFVYWASDAFRISAADRISSHAPFNFDLSVLDIFATLGRHATVSLLDETTARFPGAVRRIIETHGITVWYSVPTALAQLQARGALSGLRNPRLALYAGEVFPTPILRRVMADMPDTEFVNLFGPTETNVCAYYRLPGPPDSDFDTVPIGIPCEHLDVSLLGEDGTPVAAGEAGEICVAGSAVTAGYWQRPDLTHATRAGGRSGTYRTGDFAFIRGDGMMMLVGRRDQQVKVRGFRIELLGLEATLNACPAVREAVAVPTGDAADGGLTVFLTAAESQPEDSAVRAFVASRMAPYYVPDRIEWLTDMPRTTTGKIDRGALRLRAGLASN